MTALTGETRELNRNVYAAEAIKKVVAQHIGTITELNSQTKTNHDMFTALAKQLESSMRALLTAVDKSSCKQTIESGLSVD